MQACTYVYAGGKHVKFSRDFEGRIFRYRRGNHRMAPNQ